MASMVIDLFCATSEKIPCNVPAFSGLRMGTVIEWACGPSCLQCADHTIRGHAAR